MPPYSKTTHEDREIQSLIRDIDDLSERLEQLLNDFRDNSVSFGSIKTELTILASSVKDISVILRDGGEGGNSLLVRVALLEQRISTMVDDIKDHDAIEVADKAGHWQMRVALGTGILAVVGHIITMLLHLIGK